MEDQGLYLPRQSPAEEKSHPASEYVRMATCLFLPLHLPVLFSNKSSMLLLSCESQGPTVSRGL